MEIDQQIGGLAIAPGSHRRGELDHGGGSVASSAKGVKEKKVFGLDPESLSWVTSDFQPGDAVIFTSLTVQSRHSQPLRPHPPLMRFPLPAGDDAASWLAHTLGPKCGGSHRDRRDHVKPRPLYHHSRLRRHAGRCTPADA